jgi:threonine dehydrogenase-like Zn-dependent dehydrogenase
LKDFEIAFSSKKGFYKKKLENYFEIKNVEEVLVKPRRIGICGSDHFYMNKYDGEKLLLGHEWVGEVLESNSSSFKPGDSVTSCAVFGCGICEECIDGRENFCVNNQVLGSEDIGMLRTRVVLTAKNLIKIESSEWDTSALLEVAAIGDSVIENVKEMNNKEENNILIIGAGSVGIMAALAAIREGLNPHLIEVEKERIKIAKSLDLSACSLAEHLIKKRKYDLIADCTGDSNGKPGAVKHYSMLSSAGAKILVVGHYENNWNIDSHLFGKFSLTVKWMKGMPRALYEKSIPWWLTKLPSIQEKLITEVISIEEVSRAFEVSKNRSLGIKTVVAIND